MKLSLVAAATVLCASTLDAQGYRPMKVRSCAFADSLLGPMRDDSKADIQGFHHEERDSTYLLATTKRKNRLHLNVSIKLPGKRPTREPAAQIATFLRDDDGRVIQASQDEPIVTLVVDDSVKIQPAAAAKGTFVGPANKVLLPVSALVLADDLLRIALAHNVVMNVNAITIPFSDDERRAVRAAVRVAVCPP